MKISALIVIFLLIAMPAIAGLHQPSVIIKKPNAVSTKIQQSSLTSAHARKFGEPRRERGSRYFEETKANDFSTPAFGAKKLTENSSTNTANNPHAANTDSTQKTESNPSKQSTGQQTTRPSSIKPAPSEVKGQLSSGTTFTKNARFQRWKAPTGEQLRGGISK